MRLTRRQTLAIGALAATGLAGRATAQAPGVPFDQPKSLYGFPAGRAGDIVCRRVAERDKAVIDGIGVVGLIPQGSTIDEMARSQCAELERWGPLVKRIGFTADS
jgi:hypothetical protein